jgi:phosphoribosylglycinamide formyltransferase-1
MMARKRVAILISGRGSNMAALIEAARDPDYPAEIVLVVSSRPEAEGLAHAAAAGIATAVVDHTAFAGKAAFEAALDARLAEASAEIVCLAGFMRLLSPGFVERWRDRLINIHPSLLPAFPGLDTHARAISAGAKVHGCTVHFVRAAMDDGPIIAQTEVPVLPGDTPESLAARVLVAEHRLYPEALADVAAGKSGVPAMPEPSAG